MQTKNIRKTISAVWCCTTAKYGMIYNNIIRTRSATRWNEFSRESANDWCRYTSKLYKTTRWYNQRWTHPSPAEQNDWSWMRDISGRRKTAVLVDHDKNHLRPGGWARRTWTRRRMPSRPRPPAAHRRAPPSPAAVPSARARARATETGWRAGRRDGDENGPAAAVTTGYWRPAGAVIGQPWKGERGSSGARTHAKLAAGTPLSTVSAATQCNIYI